MENNEQIHQLPIPNMETGDPLLDSCNIPPTQELRIRDSIRQLEKNRRIPKEILEIIFYLLVDNYRKKNALVYLMGKVL